MGPSSDQIEREIVQMRGSMESKIVELRARGERRIRQVKRTALIVGGAGAVIGVAVIGAFVIYRLTRPVTARERARRLLPKGMTGDLRRARRRMRDRIPPVRLYVGDRQVSEEPRVTHWERIAVRAAQAAGTAAASAVASRVLAGVAEAMRSRSDDSNDATPGRT
jgi:hypothetical protein